MRKSQRTLFGLAVLLGGLLAVPAAFAQAQTARIRLPVQSMSVSLDLLIDGQSQSTVSSGGRTYLPVSHWGQEYSIRVTNNGPRRIAAVVSVDGLSVISGKSASSNDAGYIVDAHSSVTIKGWRRDLDQVAAFSFEERGNSYAGKMGRPENVGVIGLIAFEEQGPDIRLTPRAADGGFGKGGKSSGPETKSSDQAGSRPFAPPPSSPAVGGTGTGYGRTVDSAVQYVDFVRGSNRRSITIYYDTRAALREAGIIVDDVRPMHPRPFPTDSGFAPPPPGDSRR